MQVKPIDQLSPANNNDNSINMGWPRSEVIESNFVSSLLWSLFTIQKHIDSACSYVHVDVYTNTLVSSFQITWFNSCMLYIGWRNIRDCKGGAFKPIAQVAIYPWCQTSWSWASLYDSHWNKPAYMQKTLLDNSTCIVNRYTTLGFTRKEGSITCCSSQWKTKKSSSRSPWSAAGSPTNTALMGSCRFVYGFQKHLWTSLQMYRCQTVMDWCGESGR